MTTTKLVVLQETEALTDDWLCSEQCPHLNVPLTTVGPPVCKLLRQTLYMTQTVSPLRVVRPSECHEAERRAKYGYR